MSGVLAVTVHVVEPETGEAVVLLAGTEAPSWAVEVITNPDVWTGPAPAVEPVEPVEPVEEHSDDEPDDEPPAPGPDDEPPPHGGPGSSAAHWRQYAAAHDVEVAPDAHRDAVIDACREAGVRVD